MANLMVLFISLDLLLLASEFLVGLYGQIPEHLEVYRQILFGPFPYTFWLGQLLLGALIPIALATLPGFRNRVFWLGLGGLSAVIGIVAVRLNLVIPAYVVPVLKGLERAIQQPRWAYTYFPSFWEWVTSIGIIAIVVLFFSLAYQLLPMFHEFPARFETSEGGAAHG